MDAFVLTLLEGFDFKVTCDISSFVISCLLKETYFVGLVDVQ
jgi:hypothetical protein